MISCKCLNFTATSPHLQLQRSSSVTNSPGGVAGTTVNNNNNSSSSNNNINNIVNNGDAGEAALPVLLSQAFMQKIPRDFRYYSQFMDFFKHANGPIPDLTINAISQSILIYGVTLDVAGQSWQLSICINCEVVLCAKRLIAGAGATPTHYLINSTLLCSQEELARRRNSKSYSEVFELVIMDHEDAASSALGAVATTPPPTGIVNSASSLSIGSFSAHAPLDARLQRRRQLQLHHLARVQAEINETNERIERFTEQKFALLKSFREKADQEGALLSRLIQQLPDNACDLMDRGMPAALEATGGGISYDLAAGPGTRRRNTISSRRELGVPTTPTTPLIQPPSFLALTQLPQQQQQQQQPQPLQPLPSATIITTRKLSNFDTPPATPEATPMSVGNSPTFRQQQQAAVGANPLLLQSTPAVASTATDDADDCLFDLEDVDGPGLSQGQSMQHYQQQQRHYERLQQQHSHLIDQRLQLQQQQQQHDQDNMSDADEAEDALDLDTSWPIPMPGARGAGGVRATASQKLYANYARSLPVEIGISPRVERVANNNIISNNNHNNNVVLEDDEVIDNTVDIAASIKALAKSVHGEAVFGDLPRPRLRSQI